MLMKEASDRCLGVDVAWINLAVEYKQAPADAFDTGGPSNAEPGRTLFMRQAPDAPDNVIVWAWQRRRNTRRRDSMQRTFPTAILTLKRVC